MRAESDMKNVLFFLSCSYLLITKETVGGERGEREREREGREKEREN